MEQLVVNLVTSTKRQGDYLVAPLTMIVPGVFPGSLGPLYYPPEEVANNVSAWNDIAIVVYHPSKNGQSVAAKGNHEVWRKQGIGHIRNARVEDGKLRADGFFHIDRTLRVDNRVFQSLKYGLKIELSTGLYTTNKPAPSGSHHEGITYTHVATDYRPDHLAILPDQRGACNVEDGCGVFNQDASGSLSNLDSYEAIMGFFADHSGGDDKQSLDHVTSLL